jgi:pyruvate/2-oxoglutarate dehydrogenase complex dihydrolipoamide acyltransferase (E2) component
MSDTTEPTDLPVVDETPTDAAPVETPDTSEVEKWKALARKNEQRAKENADKAKRLDELEEANKSEQQKLADAAELARKEAAETAVELAKLRAAVKHGLTDDDLELLGTGTPDEIEARAERLAARLKGNPAPAAPSSEGQGKQGAPVTSGVTQLTREQFAALSPEERVAAHERGQTASILGASG